jgi:hypothetical protein
LASSRAPPTVNRSRQLSATNSVDSSHRTKEFTPGQRGLGWYDTMSYRR